VDYQACRTAIRGTNPENTAARRQDEQECIAIEAIFALQSTAGDGGVENRVQTGYWVVTMLDRLFIGEGSIWRAQKVTDYPVDYVTCLSVEQN